MQRAGKEIRGSMRDRIDARRAAEPDVKTDRGDLVAVLPVPVSVAAERKSAWKPVSTAGACVDGVPEKPRNKLSARA